MTEYVFLMLPFAYRYSSKYLFLGNERSCNYYALDKYGNKCYPSFDQSSEWMLEINKMLGSFGNARVGSLVEPLDDLAILKILHRRYPKLAKYQYSCFPDESKKIENERWCCNCSKCARLYIMLKAIGVDPRNIGITKNMLEKDSKYLYSIFNKKSQTKVEVFFKPQTRVAQTAKAGVLNPSLSNKKGKKTLYDEIGVGRKEQLYAFYLAYKKGAKGKLIDEFKKMYIGLAKEKEDEWRKEFFSVHSSPTIPQNLKTKINSIFKEELGKG